MTNEDKELLFNAPLQFLSTISIFVHVFFAMIKKRPLLTFNLHSRKMEKKKKPGEVV
jgi:hypothetical protein